MNSITINQFDKLKKLSEAKFSHYLDYSEAKDLWSRSVYYNKLQNQFIKDNEESEVVTSLQLFDEETKEVNGFSIRANKNYSRFQWFTLLLGSSLYTYSRQQLKEIV